MTTLKKSLKKNLSLKKSLKKNLSLKKSLSLKKNLKKSLKKASGKENKSMRGGARPRYRPSFSGYQPTYAPKPQPSSMFNLRQQNPGNFKTAGISIPSAHPFTPQNTGPQKPSPKDFELFYKRQADPNAKKLRLEPSKAYQRTITAVRQYLEEQSYLDRLKSQ